MAPIPQALERGRPPNYNGMVVSSVTKTSSTKTVPAQVAEVEQALRQNEEYFRLLIENALDVITILDVDGTIRYDSPSIERVLGYKPEDRIGKNAFELVHAEDQPGVLQVFNRIIQNRESSASVEFRFRHKDGSWRIIEAVGRSLTDNSGVTGVLVNSRDVSRRKKTEEALLNAHHELEIRVRERTGELSKANEKLRQEIEHRKHADRDLAVQYAVTTMLAGASSLADVTPKILKVTCENLGWEVGALWIVRRETTALRCVDIRHSSSISIRDLKATREMTVKPGVGLLGRVWTTGEPVWITEILKEANCPREQLASKAGLHTAFIFPVFMGNQVTAVMEFFTREIRRPDYEMIQIMDALGSQVSQFIERMQAEEERARLLEREKATRAEAESAERRATFLAEASTLLASSLDYPITVAKVARLAVPHIADWCVVDVVQENQSVQTLEVAHRDPAKVELARQLQRRYPPKPSDPYGVLNVLRTGKSEIYPEVPDSALVEVARDAEHLRILRDLGLRSAMVVPLGTRGHIAGAITLVTAESGRRYGPSDLALAEDLARRVAIAIDNARLYTEAEQALFVRDRALANLRANLLQQAAVAELGQCALASSGLSTLMDETLRLVVETLEVEYCEILELLSGGDVLLLRAGLGWRNGCVGNATVEAGAKSHAGFALLSREPFTIDDFRAETRFEVPQHLRDHDIVSGVCVIVQGQEQPYGILGAHTRRRRTFNKDEVYFLVSVANILGTAIERHRMQAALRSLSLTDELTGLCNRRGFMALAEQHLKLARRMNRRVEVVFADLDGLKQINDTFGHQAGDEALAKTAGILKETFRHSDIIGRIGGDEFVVLAMEDSSSSTRRIITRLKKNLKNYSAQSIAPYKLSFSVGVAHFDASEGTSIEEMIAQADKALYKHRRSRPKSGATSRNSLR